LICARGEKSCPPSIHVAVTPAEKGADCSHSHCLSSFLSISPSDERGAMIASTTKGPAACVWMRLSFLLSFLLLPYLSLLTPSDLSYSHFPLHPLPSPLPPLLLYLSPPDVHSLALLLRFFVRASAIQSGDGIKNQKVSLSRRHPGWRTLMSPRKFEIHMLSHFILPPTPSSLSLTHTHTHTLSPSAFSFSSSSSSSPPSSAVMSYSVRKTENAGERKKQVFLKALSCLLFFTFFHFVKKAGRYNESFNVLLIVGPGVRGLRR